MIQAKNLTKIYPVGKKLFKAVDGVSLSIERGETLGLVGESGCGKSTLARMIVGLIKPSSGQLFYDSKEITGTLHPRKIQMIFQDPYSSLNPRMSIKKILEEPTKIHKLPSRVDELLDLVGLPIESQHRFPHEFSGGQRQRIGIARALALMPEFLICDEPISALDVSIQAQIGNLLIRLQKELKLTILFIAHDLAMVRYLSSKIAVMHQGKIIELKKSEDLIKNPEHPFTRSLIQASLQPYSDQVIKLSPKTQFIQTSVR